MRDVSSDTSHGKRVIPALWCPEGSRARSRQITKCCWKMNFLLYLFNFIYFFLTQKRGTTRCRLHWESQSEAGWIILSLVHLLYESMWRREKADVSTCWWNSEQHLTQCAICGEASWNFEISFLLWIIFICEKENTKFRHQVTVKNVKNNTAHMQQRLSSLLYCFQNIYSPVSYLMSSCKSV